MARECAGFGGGRNVFEKLSGDVLLPVVGSDMECRHPDLRAGLLQTDAGPGEQVEHVCVAALCCQVYRSEAGLVLVVWRDSVGQHDPDSLQVTSLSGEVEGSVLIEPVLGLRHQGGVDIEHGGQDIHRPFLREGFG